MTRDELLVLRDDITDAKLKLRSRGGRDTLRFSVYERMGWIITSSRRIIEILCLLWNESDEILKLAIRAHGDEDE